MRSPKEVLDAFFPPTITVGGLQLKHRFSVAHWLALEKIGSPLTENRTSIKLIDAVRALYIVALPPDQVFDAAVSPDLEKHAAALAGRIPLPECVGLVKAITEHINTGFGPAPAPADRTREDEEESQAADPFGSRDARAPVGSSRSSRKSAGKRVGRSKRS